MATIKAHATHPPPVDVKPSTVKSRVLHALTRLNEKDTQRYAVEELLDIIRELDHEGLPSVISALCSPVPEQKPFARKETIRALAILVSDATTVWQQAVQQYTTKILTLVRKGMQDSDAGVRDACAEMLSSLALAMYRLSGSPLPGSLSHPILRLIFDCICEQKKECQFAAGQALLQVSPFIGPVDKEVLRDVLKALKSPTFQAAGALLAALASSDTEQSQYLGLVKSGPSAFTPYTSHLLGQPASASAAGSGMLGCLSHKEWTVRRAAADALRVTAALLGPSLEPEARFDRNEARSISGRAFRALEACKFDKVKEVREVVREALLLYEELLAFGAQGGSLSDWQAAHPAGAEVDPASGSPCHTPGAPSPTSAGAPLRRLSSGSRAGSINERFRRAQTPRDVVAEPSVKQLRSGTPRTSSGTPGASAREYSVSDNGVEAPGSEGASEQQSASWQLAAEPRALQFSAHQPQQAGSTPLVQLYDRPPPHVEVSNGAAALEEQEPAAAKQQQRGSAVRRYSRPATPSGSKPPSRRATAEGVRGPPAPGGAEGVAVTAVEWAAVQQRLQQLEEGQRQQAALAQQVADSAAATAELQAKVAQLEAALAHLQQQPAAAVGGAQPMRRQTWDTATAAATDFSLAGTSSSQAHIRSPLLRPPDMPAPESCLSPDVSIDAAAAGVRSRFAPSADAFSTPAAAQAAANGMRMLRIGPHQALRTTSMPHMHASAGSTDYSLDGITVMTPTSASDLESAFSRVLRDGAGDMQLARLLQRTGIVWNSLSPSTCTDLLSAFIRWLQEGTLVRQVLKWLWRLADHEHCSFEVPLQQRSQLLLALRLVNSLDDPQEVERLQDLINTLDILWAGSNGSCSSPRLGSAGGAGVQQRRSASLRGRSSVEGLRELHTELDQLQRDFQAGSGGSSPTAPH